MSAQHQKIPVGSYVEDRTDDDPNRAVVVHRPGVTCDQWVIEGTEMTVADYNRLKKDLDVDYTEDEVLLVAFEDELFKITEWQVSTPESLWPLVEEKNLDYYAYPESHLKKTGMAVEQRRKTTGERFIHRLHITKVGDRLVYGTDYDGVDHQYGVTRDVCFNKPENTQLQEDNVVHIEYGKEKDIEALPPLLADISVIEIIEETASPDFLHDL